MLTMTIRDNGVGMQPGSRNRHGSFGLVGIEERVGILGGSFSISSGLDAGTTVVVSIPVTPMFGSDDDAMYRGARSTVAVAA